MTRVERDGASFVVPANVLAAAFAMSKDELRAAMRDGTLTSTCEAGVGTDAGRWRLTFRHSNRACRYTVDETGLILSTSRFPIGALRPRGPE